MAIVYKSLGLRSLRASGSITTVQASTVGNLALSISGLAIKIQLPGATGSYSYVVFVSTTPFASQGGSPGYPIGGSATGISASSLIAGITYNAPHWGTTYYFSVLTDGAAVALATASISTPAYVPGAPTITSVVPSQTTLMAEWSAIANATSYVVYLNGRSVATVKTPAYQFTGLSPATQYTIGVQAVAPDVV